MARKKPYKIDSPTKTITIAGVSSAIADQFNELMTERRETTGLSKAQIFENIVLDERRKDVGDYVVRCTMEIYKETQERLIKMNEDIIQSKRNIENTPE